MFYFFQVYKFKFFLFLFLFFQNVVGKGRVQLVSINLSSHSLVCFFWSQNIYVSVFFSRSMLMLFLINAPFILFHYFLGLLSDLYSCLACDARISLFVSALWLRDIRKVSKVWIHAKLYLFGCQRQDAWNLHILSCIRGPVGPISSRCNVLLCRSVLVPGGGNEIPVMKSAAVVLERYIHCYGMLNVRNLTECARREILISRIIFL